ncbi:MAG: hypothetical protein WC749_03590 [Dehalococcoidia bacterium]
MNMAGEIRVRTDPKYRELYNGIKSFGMGDMHELFFLCVCLGYKAREKKRLTSKDERFWSRTVTPDEYACYYAMVLERNDMDLSKIQDDTAVISEMEEYANAGIEILLRECLSDYLAKTTNEVRLDPTSSEMLPRALLHFVFEQIQ